MNYNPLHCRMCIARDDNQEFIPLIGNNAHLKQKFEFCFSIPLNSSNLNVLCPQCADKLTEIAMVFIMVKDSDSFFNQLPTTGSYQNRPGSWNKSLDYNPLEQEQYHRPDMLPRAMMRFTDDNSNGYEPIPQLMYPSSHQNDQQDTEPSRNWNSNRHFHHDDENYSQGWTDYNDQGHSSNYSGNWNNNNFPQSQERFSGQNQGRNESDSIEISDSEDDNIESKNSFIRNGRRVFPCRICNKEFNLVKLRRIHLAKVHHNQSNNSRNNFKCPFCDEPFQFIAGLKLHLNLFDHMRCNICKFRCENLNQLQHHVKLCKRAQNSFECPYCLKKFGTANGCNNHIDSVHKVIPNRL